MKSWQKALVPLLVLVLLAIILILLFTPPGDAQFPESPIPKPAICQYDCPASVLDNIDCDTAWCCYGIWEYPPGGGVTGSWSGYKWACEPGTFVSPIQVQRMYSVYLPIVSR